MTVHDPVRFIGEKRMDTHPLQSTNYTSQQAEAANHEFDQTVIRFLAEQIQQGTFISQPTTNSPEWASEPLSFEAWLEGPALRLFFTQYPDALEQLLQQPAIAAHLLRQSHEVYFEFDAYEPLLSRFERRIYNLATHQEHREVPFRYTPISRQTPEGDTRFWTDDESGHREDIGCYFGTRRSDETALGILARQLHKEAEVTDKLPMYAMTEGYMEDALRAIRTQAEQLAQTGQTGLHGFVIQRRHAQHDRHLGAAFLLMDPAAPDQPRRVIFCDTLNPSGTPPWWNTFKRVLDAVFPMPEGTAPVSDRLEDGSVNLQRLHDGVPVRHQDIDCAFYTASIGRAIIQLASQHPEILCQAPISEVMTEVTARMPDYFEEANVAKLPTIVREINVIRRWNTGREALLELLQH